MAQSSLNFNTTSIIFVRSLLLHCKTTSLILTPNEFKAALLAESGFVIIVLGVIWFYLLNQKLREGDD